MRGEREREGLVLGLVRDSSWRERRGEFEREDVFCCCSLSELVLISISEFKSFEVDMNC